MPITLLGRCKDDSIREFRGAARERYRDALALAEAGRRTAAIYLWGYCAEMTLKAAYFRLIGVPEASRIEMSDLRLAAVKGVNLGVLWPGRGKSYNLHDLRAWGDLIVNTRSGTPGLAYRDPSFGNRVTSEVRRLGSIWAETLRYRKILAHADEVARARDVAGWLLANSQRL